MCTSRTSGKLIIRKTTDYPGHAAGTETGEDQSVDTIPRWHSQESWGTHANAHQCTTECSGATTWLTAHPYGKVRFCATQTAFKNAFCLRFEWTPQRLASHSQCDDVFSVANAFSCPNQVDITAQLLTAVCPNFGIEPLLQPQTSKTFFPWDLTNHKEEAWLHMKAQEFWDNSKKCVFFVWFTGCI